MHGYMQSEQAEALDEHVQKCRDGEPGEGNVPKGEGAGKTHPARRIPSYDGEGFEGARLRQDLFFYYLP